MEMCNEPSSTIHYDVLRLRLHQSRGPRCPFAFCLTFEVDVYDIANPTAPQCITTSATILSHNPKTTYRTIDSRDSLKHTFATWPSSDAHLLAKQQAALVMFDLIEELFGQVMYVE